MSPAMTRASELAGGIWLRLRARSSIKHRFEFGNSKENNSLKAADSGRRRFPDSL
jgi:hypothetical protein